MFGSKVDLFLVVHRRWQNNGLVCLRGARDQCGVIRAEGEHGLKRCVHLQCEFIWELLARFLHGANAKQIETACEVYPSRNLASACDVKKLSAVMLFPEL